MDDMPKRWSSKIEFVTATKLERHVAKRESNFWVEAKRDGEKLEDMISFVEAHKGGPVYYAEVGIGL